MAGSLIVVDLGTQHCVLVQTQVEILSARCPGLSVLD